MNALEEYAKLLVRTHTELHIALFRMACIEKLLEADMYVRRAAADCYVVSKTMYGGEDDMPMADGETLDIALIAALRGLEKA